MAAVLVGALAWLAALFALRYGIMEVPLHEDPCLAAADGLTCRLRSGIGLAIHFQMFGITALACALLTLLPLARARAPLAALALFAALPALVLYNLRFGAPAAVIALIAAADLLPRKPRR